MTDISPAVYTDGWFEDYLLVTGILILALSTIASKGSHFPPEKIFLFPVSILSNLSVLYKMA
ncbi:hypothetical protein DXN04_00725 [Chitinophaga silvisoli]|uniref:Uncharacterized protein n=1 Tax=Chitinophaga silvisoli TaxID=2291814 RepID=A0A3E1P7D3_9BACT|nr:hypothetical protein DXN04_00725 [Chitinophaga silvisoli]